MKKETFYDGTKLLSLQDINGKKPEIYMCTTNRTGGKTTYFSRLLVNRFLDSKSKFMLIYRFNYELDDCADKFFKDIGRLFFKDYEMTSIKRGHGKYAELYLNEVACGYAVALNDADMVKKQSHMFSDTDRMFFDEFQSETNHYCPDEIRKFISVHTSVARGQGKQYRYVPVYMTANPVTILNPYYVEMGIADRLSEETRFLRGDGFILEQGYVKSAADVQKESGFNKAFKANAYTAYSTEAVYLNDNKAFIERPQGQSKYLATLRYEKTEFALRSFPEMGIIYCDKHVDGSYPGRITVTTDDHEVNYVMLKSNDGFLANMRYYFEKGAFRFQDLRCKEAVLKALSY